MPQNRLAVVSAMLCAAGLLPGCAYLGGPYVPSERVSVIAEMDRATMLPTQVSIPAPLDEASTSALGPGSLAWHTARVLRDNPIMLAAYYGMTSSGAGADQAAAARGGRLSLDSHWGATDSGGAESLRTDRGMGANGSIVLLDGGAGRFKEEQALWRAAGAAAAAADKAESVSYAVAASYIGVMKARAQALASADEVARFEHLLRQVRGLASGGAVGIADVPEAEARLERIRQQETQFEQARKDAEASFLRLSGSEAPLALEPPPELASKDAPTLVAEATSHPSVRAYEAQVRAAVKAALEVDAERFGSLTAQFGPAGFAQIFGGAGVTTLGTAFLRLQIPVFDGGERDARLRRAAADLEVALAQRDDAERSVALGIRQALHAQEAASKQARLASLERRAALRLARAREADYRAGLADLKSVLDAEQQKWEASIREDGATWDVVLASYRLSAASGRLSSTLGALKQRVVDIPWKTAEPPVPGLLARR